MKDIYEEYNDVFKDIVKSYLEDNNINKISDDEIRIIANRLIYKNDTVWEYINECIYYEVQRIKDLRKKNSYQVVKERKTNMVENRASYYYISNENVDIVPENGTDVVRYYVNCFDRELVLLFNDKNLSEQDIVEIEKCLDNAYNEWNAVITDVPCEEYMISKLDRYYRNSIVAVLYVGDDEDE